MTPSVPSPRKLPDGSARSGLSWARSSSSSLGHAAVPLFHFSDTWQLVINTGTTIVTFLMVFLIQNTQNRDAKAINLKLNELIYATAAAGDQMLDIEKLSDEELNRMRRTLRTDSR